MERMKCSPVVERGPKALRVDKWVRHQNTLGNRHLLGRIEVFIRLPYKFIAAEYYQHLIRRSQISHFAFFTLILCSKDMWIIIAVIVVIGYLIYSYGIFHPITLYQDDLKAPYVVYYSFKGPKQDLGAEFDKLTKAAHSHFKLSNFFGIYYSRPEEPVWKCVLGIVVNPGEIQKVEGFLSENPWCKSRQMRTVSYVGASMPYVNSLSFFLLPLKIPKFITLLEKQGFPLFKGVIQIYRFNFRPKSIEFINPLNNQQQFQLFQQE